MDADVLAANESFYRAFNDRDVAAMEALWAVETPVWCVHPGWNVLTGRDEVLESWRAILANPTQQKIVAGGASVLIRDTLAVVTCRELVAGNPLAATNIFINEHGEWKLIHHQSSPVMRM